MSYISGSKYACSASPTGVEYDAQTRGLSTTRIVFHKVEHGIAVWQETCTAIRVHLGCTRDIITHSLMEQLTIPQDDRK